MPLSLSRQSVLEFMNKYYYSCQIFYCQNFIYFILDKSQNQQIRYKSRLHLDCESIVFQQINPLNFINIKQMQNLQVPFPSSVPRNTQVSQDPRLLTIPRASGVYAPTTNILTNPLPYQPGVLHPGSFATGIPPAGVINNQASRNVIVSQPIPASVRVGQTARTMTQQVGGLGVGIVGGAIAGKPNSSSRIQYVPYEKKVVEYQTRQILTSMWVPIQKKCLNYYAIQNITQFLPKQIDDIRYEMVPEQQINYRLQYVPIQKKIVHLPKTQQEYYNRMNLYDVNRSVPYGQYSQYRTGGLDLASLGYGDASAFNRSSQYRLPLLGLDNRNVPKTNFVTSDGYVPSFMRPDPLPTLPPSLKSNTGGNLLANNDLIQGIKNSLSGGGGQNLNAPSYPSGSSGPSFLNDNALLSGIAASIKKNTNQNTDTAANFMNNRSLAEGIAASIKQGDGGFRRSDSSNYRDNAVAPKPRDTRLTDKDSMEFERYWS